MRNAPSVAYPVSRSVFHAWLLALLASLGLLVQAAWWWPIAGTAPAIVQRDVLAGLIGAVLWALWLGFAWRGWLRAPVGQLQWDALATPPDGLQGCGAWRWRSAAGHDAAPLRRVDLVLDLQQRALLRLRDDDAAQSWVWVERAGDPAHWNDLRRALQVTR